MVSEIFPKNHFVTAEAATAEADIDDSIKRKRVRVSLKKSFVTLTDITVMPVRMTINRKQRCIAQLENHGGHC